MIDNFSSAVTFPRMVVLLFGGVGSLFYILSHPDYETLGRPKIFGLAFSWLLIFLGLAFLAVWMFREVNLEFDNRQRSRSRSERVSALDALTRLSDEAQLEIAKTPEMIQLGASLFMDDQDLEIDLFYITSSGELIEFESFREFIKASNIFELSKIGDYAGGSARECASMITEDLVKKGIANPAAGNKPARWGQIKYDQIFNKVTNFRS